MRLSQSALDRPLHNQVAATIMIAAQHPMHYLPAQFFQALAFESYAHEPPRFLASSIHRFAARFALQLKIVNAVNSN
jgi:hypothetical protein